MFGYWEKPSSLCNLLLHPLPNSVSAWVTHGCLVPTILEQPTAERHVSYAHVLCVVCSACVYMHLYMSLPSIYKRKLPRKGILHSQCHSIPVITNIYRLNSHYETHNDFFLNIHLECHMYIVFLKYNHYYKKLINHYDTQNQWNIYLKFIWLRYSLLYSLMTYSRASDRLGTHKPSWRACFSPTLSHSYGGASVDLASKHTNNRCIVACHWVESRAINKKENKHTDRVACRRARALEIFMLSCFVMVFCQSKKTHCRCFKRVERRSTCIKHGSSNLRLRLFLIHQSRLRIFNFTTYYGKSNLHIHYYAKDRKCDRPQYKKYTNKFTSSFY